MKELLRSTGIALWVWVVGIVFIAGAAAFFLYVQPYMLDKERSNIKHSRQYVETQQTKLNNLCIDYDQLMTQEELYKDNAAVLEGLKNQEIGIIQQMKVTAAMIPVEEVPQCVKEKIR
jgi:glycosylphosphatidylinositol transamidase (GPIT) subunit GPI8